MTYDSIILGAGVSGLTLGYKLEKNNKKILIIEKNSRTGGVINSKREDGFLKEFGPSTSLYKKELKELVEELKIEDRVLYPREVAKNRFLVDKKENGDWTLVKAPHSPISAILWPLLSFKAKLGLFKEPFIKKTEKEDEDVYSFMSRRLGDEVTKKVISSMLSGIWASDIKTLSTRSSLPKFWSFEKNNGSIIKGAIKYRKENPQKRKYYKGLITFKDGIIDLIKTLENNIKKESILLNTEIKEIKIIEENNLELKIKKENKEIKTLKTKSLIITTPSWITAKIISPLSPSLSKSLEDVPYSPLGIIHLGIKKSTLKKPLDAFGFLCPPKKEDVLLGAIFNSSLFLNRAKPNYELLTCMVGGGVNKKGADIEKEENLKKAIFELKKVLNLKEDPKILSTKYLKKAIPNYPINHHNLIKEIKEFNSKHPNIHLLANYQKAIGVPDRIKEVKEFLKNQYFS